MSCEREGEGRKLRGRRELLWVYIYMINEEEIEQKRTAGRLDQDDQQQQQQREYPGGREEGEQREEGGGRVRIYVK